jgi:cation diffusion facilitator family transporter
LLSVKLEAEAMEETERYQTANKVSKLTLTANILLSIIKISAGIFARSSAMTADGIHTLSDVLTTFAVIIGMKFSTKPDDADHPYGHEKIESGVSVILAFFLILTALGIGISGVKTIYHGTYVKPGILAAAAAVLSIVTKEWMYRYTVKAADKIKSNALKADAWHHRSDAFSSIGTLVGIVGAIIGFGILDPLASIVVCVMIVKVGIDIYKSACNQLFDKAADNNTVDNITKTILSVEGVKSIDDLKTRIHGSRIFVDVEIAVDAGIDVYHGDMIAENVHHEIEQKFSDVKHCMVHVNPYFEE